MVQFLYAVMTVPMIFVSLINDPLYRIILSGQSDAENFDFKTGTRKFSSPLLFVSFIWHGRCIRNLRFFCHLSLL